MCIVDRTIIRNIWKLRMGLSVEQSSCSIPSFYPSPVRISMARRLPVIAHSGWATVKLDIGKIHGLGEAELMLNPFFLPCPCPPTYYRGPLVASAYCEWG